MGLVDPTTTARLVQPQLVQPIEVPQVPPPLPPLPQVPEVSQLVQPGVLLMLLIYLLRILKRSKDMTRHHLFLIPQLDEYGIITKIIGIMLILLVN